MLVTKDYYAQFLASRGYGPEGPAGEDPGVSPYPEGALEICRFLHELGRSVPICILSDFDCDGIMAGTVWYLFLSLLGFSNVRIAERDTTAGYEVRSGELSAASGAAVLLTSDVGAAARALVAAAKGQGMAVAVTDHHLCAPEDSTKGLADYFCDPCCDDHVYDGPLICGAMVVHRIAELYFRTYPGESSPEILADLAIAGHFAAIATVSDGMPMTGRNREAVREMLRFFSYAVPPASGEPVEGLSSHPLIQNVLDNFYRFTMGITPGYYEGFDMDFLVYQIIPAINSVKRMGRPTALAYGMLFGDEGTSSACTEALAALNGERKILVGQITEELYAAFSAGDFDYSHVFLLPAGMPPGTCGLVAQKMAEYLAAPALALLPDGRGGFSGSARSFDGWPLLSSVNRSGLAVCRGHQEACGVHVDSSAKLAGLDRLLSDGYAVYAASRAAGKAVRPYDVLMDFNADFLGFRRRLSSFLSRAGDLGPFGNGFPAPMVCLKARLSDGLYSGFGAGGTAHTRVDLGRGLRCLLWNTDLSSVPYLAHGGTIYAVGTLSRHYFGGSRAIELAGSLLADPPNDGDLYEESELSPLLGPDGGDPEEAEP